MQLRFWGVRGSIPTPGPHTVRYGGNTTCLEVRSDDGTLIILDAGSGIRGLGLELARQMPVACNIFISHTHWDHIQGLPFFVPLFVPGNTVTIHGLFDPVSMRSIRDVLAVQMEYRFFPVREAELRADIDYATLKEGQQVTLGDATVTAVLMNHPVLCLGYIVACNGKSLFFTGDHEHFQNIYSPNDPEYDDFQKHILEKKQAIMQHIRGVDLLVTDAQYTEEEYVSKVGWGHSTFPQGLEMAREAGAKKVYFTHHEPTRTDDELDTLLVALRRDHGSPEGPEINLAREGETVQL